MSQKSFIEKRYGNADPDKGKIIYSDEGTESAIGVLYDDDFLDLANVILLQAVEDYAYAYKLMLTVYGSKSKFPTKKEFIRKTGRWDYIQKACSNYYSEPMAIKLCLYYETLDFFESEWGKFLMRNIKVPLKDIIKKIETDVELKMCDKRKFNGRGCNTKKSLV